MFGARLFAPVAVASVLVLAACGGSSVDNQAAGDCVDDINKFRATLGLAPYARWTDEETCVDTQAQDDAASGVPHSAFGHCGELAQDECPNWPGPPDSMIEPCLQMMWNEGPGTDFSTHGHYLNMSNASYTMAACGYYTLPNGMVWGTQDFK